MVYHDREAWGLMQAQMNERGPSISHCCCISNLHGHDFRFSNNHQGPGPTPDYKIRMGGGEGRGGGCTGTISARKMGGGGFATL